MAFDFMPPVEGGAKGLCHRCRATKPRDAFGPSPKPNRARDHICLSCRAEMDAAPARRGRPKGVKRQPNVCTGCSKHVAERIQGEWICAPCRAKKSVAYKHRVGIHKARPAPVVPSDVPDRTWRAIEERNARDAWRYWVKVKAPKAWLDAYHSRKPWARASSPAEEYRIRYRADAEFRLRQIIRNYDRKAKRGRYGEQLRAALKSGRPASKVSEALGYSMDRLRSHLERQFTKRMTWERFNAGQIHIDHIIPLSSFDLSDPDEMRAAWSLTNLRPLWAKDNLAKWAHRQNLL